MKYLAARAAKGERCLVMTGSSEGIMPLADDIEQGLKDAGVKHTRLGSTFTVENGGKIEIKASPPYREPMQGTNPNEIWINEAADITSGAIDQIIARPPGTKTE